MSKIIYHYHPLTGELLGAGEADTSPLEPDTFILPAHATDIEPPAAAVNEAAVFTAGAWQVVADYRGQTLFDAGGNPVKIEFLGDMPVGLTSTVPAVIALERARAIKTAEINAARSTANTGTFSHGGKAIAVDQLSRSDIDGVNGYVALYGGALPPGFPGAWKAVDNTYLPIADVDAWKAFYTSMIAAGGANFAHAQELKAQLAAATTPEQIAAIQW